jgi:hypothetical protein
VSSLGPIDYVGNGLILVFSGWAIVELFLLRAAAIRALLFVLLMNFGLTAVNLLETNWLEAVGLSGMVTVGVSWAVLAAVLAYAWKLKRDGVLS